MVIAFFLNILILRRKASKWFESKKWGPPFLISVIWFAIGFLSNWLFPNYGFLIAIFANIIIGTILVMIFYDRGFGKSLAFIIVVMIVVFILLVIIIIILVVILVIIVM
jgi:hypothetical protein